MIPRAYSIVSTSLLLQVAFADFAGEASSVSSLAVGLSSQVEAWSSPEGLVAALGIQNAFPTLSSAVVALSSAAGSISDADVDPAGTSALATSISNLLASLTSKAGDFQSVGALSIVQNDISSLEGPSVAIVQDIVDAVSGDCDKIGSLTSALDAIAGGFSSADSAYSISSSEFASAPSCSATSSVASSSSSALPSSTGPSSAAPTTPAPTTPAPTTPAPTTAAPSTPASTTVGPSTSVAPTSTTPTTYPTLFASPASVVSSIAVDLSSKVAAWSSPAGLVAALGIQNEFPSLSSAVGVLSSAAGSISDSDIDPSGTNALASSIADLLAALTDKASDFQSVGASSIVENDISSLQGPTVAIVQDIVDAVSGDCDKVGSLTSALDAIANGFSSADSAYSISPSSFAQPPSCSGGATGTGSASAPVTTYSGTSTSYCVTTQTNQGITCSPSNNGFSLWSAANKVITSVLDDVNKLANSIGLGLIADLATLATGLVDAVNDAHNKLKNLECLVPSQAADLFSGFEQLIKVVTNLLTSMNKSSGILSVIPGASQVVQFVAQQVVSAINSYVSTFSSLLQKYPGNYACSGITAVNAAIGLLNDALSAIGSALGFSVSQVGNVSVTNCRNPTTVITGLCSAAATSS